jgi:hypothetical protein
VFFADKAAGNKDDNSPPSNDEGRNERSYTSSPSYDFIVSKGTTMCLFLLIKLFYISIRTTETVYVTEKETNISLCYKVLGINSMM